jgi:hypothetical protein
MKIACSHLFVRVSGAALALLTATSATAIAQDTINTDRPGLSFSPWLVPTGRFQAEFGLPSLTQTRGDGVDTSAWSTPLQLRYGLSSSLELRLGSSMYNVVHDNNAHETIEGWGDAEIGAKLALCNADGGACPKAALVGGVRLPVGSDDFTAHEMGFDLNITGDWDLGSGNAMRGTAGFVRTPVDGDDATSGLLDAVFMRTFDSEWSGYAEAGYLPGFHAASDQAYIGAGLALLVSNDVQLDVSGDFGLNDASSDAIVGFGISVRL